LEPDALIAAVGTEIYLNGSDTSDPTWSEKLSQGGIVTLVVATTAHSFSSQTQNSALQS